MYIELGRVTTFLCVDPGPLAIGAVIYRDYGDQNTSNQYIERLVEVKKSYSIEFFSEFFP